MATPVQVSRNHLPRSPMGVYNLGEVHRSRMKKRAACVKGAVPSLVRDTASRRQTGEWL